MAAQPVAVSLIQHAFLCQNCQGVIQGRRAQRRVPASVNQLVTLYDEFNLPDTATAELDITGERFFCELAVDQCFHGPDRLKGAKVKVFSVNERPQIRKQFVPRGNVTRNRTGLDQRIAFPLTAMGQEVMVDRVKGQCQGSAIPIGAKSHVYPEDDPFGGWRLQDIDQSPTELDEELVVADGPCAVGRSVFPVSKNQINVRRHVEFTSAELSQSKDGQLHGGAAILADGLSKTVDEFAVGTSERGFNGRIGQGG